jgi:hypothetical protein
MFFAALRIPTKIKLAEVGCLKFEVNQGANLVSWFNV